MLLPPCSLSSFCHEQDTLLEAPVPSAQVPEQEMWSDGIEANLQPATCDTREILVATTTETWRLFLTAAKLMNTSHYHI